SDATARTIYIDGVTMVKGGVASSYTNAAGLLQVDPLYNVLTLNNNYAGEIQPWQTSPNNVLTSLASKGVAANGYVYLLSGLDGITPTENVFYAKLSSTGGVGTWN